MQLSDKVVLITGATSGIGHSLSKLLFLEGASVVLIARRKELLLELKSLAADQNKVEAIECDVTNSIEIRKAFDKTIEKFGRIDLAILNAGISGRAPITNFQTDKARKIFDVNVFGIINFLELLIPYFTEIRNGIIVGVSSLADARGFVQSGFYCASKSAATTLLESVRVELKPYNIKVLTVKPGFVKTPMTDKNEFYMPFMINADKAAKIILNGIKKEKKIIQFPLPIVIGSRFLKILPNFLFDWLSSKQLPQRSDR
jgi:short-subunit dehydrogenase